MDTSKAILILQVLAALFMATDYFFDEDQRKSINTKLQSLAQPIQDRVDEDLRSYWAVATQQWAKIVVSVIFVVLVLTINFVAPHLRDHVAPVLMALLGLLGLLFLAGALPFLTSILVEAVVPATLAASLRSVTWFLIHCPKGTVFGIGFLFLITSFAVRYAALES